MFSSKLLNCLWLSLWFIAGGANAESKLEAVEVVGHYENGVGTSDAASAGAVTAKLLENRPALRPGEVLEFIPGVIVTQHSGDGKANQYFLRGFNLDHGTDFATSMAGMPINMRSHAHGQGYTDLNFLIPELVERIDYKKGPYYAELGDFANAGAAQISLFNFLPRGIASLTGGEHQFMRALLADSAALDTGSLLYALELSRNNGPWEEPEHFQKNNGVLRYGVGDRDNGFSVTGMAYSARWDATDQIPARADSGSVDRFGSLDASDGGVTHRYSFSYEGAHSDSNGRDDFVLYAVKSDLKLFSNFTYFLDNPLVGDQFEQAEQRQMYGFSGSRSWFGNWLGHHSDTRLGVEGRYDRLNPIALYATVAREHLRTIRRDSVKEGSAGIYLANTMHWSDWLRTVVGARFDTYRFDVNSNVAENSGTKSASITSPKLSIIVGPWARTEFFVNYGEGFHSNDARGATQHVTAKENESTAPVTPLVKTRGAEMGARSEIVPGLQSSLALWQLRLGSELVFVGDAGDTEPTRASKRYGLEWSNHYVANEWLLIDLDLSASHARFVESDPAGNYIPGAVDKIASFSFTIADLGPWFAELQLRYFGPRPLLEDNTQRSKSTTLTYLRGGYQFNSNWKGSVDIFNIFDRRVSDVDYYYTSRLQGEPADGIGDRHFHPVEPRTLRVSLTYNF